MANASRSKNPLYVVKDDHVEAAGNVFELLLKKFNLEPLWELLMNMLKMLLENAQSYAGLKILNEYLVFLTSKFKLFQKYSII